MGRDPSRKPQRKAMPIEFDAEEAELAGVLLENEEPISLDGWLSMPWRSGWAAATLALELWRATADALIQYQGAQIVDVLKGMIETQMVSPSTYEDLEALKPELLSWVLVRGQEHMRLIVVAVRCLQLQIANSSGGGHVYNDVLRGVLEKLDARGDLIDVGRHMLEARCRDAIGTTAQLQNDSHDRKRRAFAIAWKRGLYQAAYSIGGIDR